MATGEARVTIRGRFPAGSTVELRARVGDHYTGTGEVLATATVGDDRTVTFASLPEGGRYWVSTKIDGRDRWAAVVAKVPAPTKQFIPRPTGGAGHRVERSGAMREGARSTTSGVSPNATPHQRDFHDVPQASSTAEGVATPVAVAEDLESKTVPQLRELAKERGVTVERKARKADLIAALQAG